MSKAAFIASNFFGALVASLALLTCQPLDRIALGYAIGFCGMCPWICVIDKGEENND